MANYKKQIHVVCAIIVSNDEVLATCRSYGEFEGMWEFPGGKIEPGESKEEALQRELMEELHVHIEILQHFTTISYEYPSFHLIMDCFLCKLPEGEVLKPQENQAMLWLHKSRLRDLTWLPADIEIIDALMKTL